MSISLLRNMLSLPSPLQKSKCRSPGTRGQGNRIINPLKKKRKKPTGKDWRGIMDIRTELARIPDLRIDRRKKHLLVDILLLCIIAMVCGIESVEDIAFFGETHQAWLCTDLSWFVGLAAWAGLMAKGRLPQKSDII
jgi:hypothetical protein